MFNRAMADCDGVGIIVSIDYHGASYDLQTPRLLCKHLTADQVHPVPEELTLAHRLGPDATPAQRFSPRPWTTGRSNACSSVRTRFRRAGPSPPPADAVRVRPSRRNAQLAGHGRRHGHASPRHVLSPSATLYDWAMDVMSAACDGTAMPERPHGLDAERARAERRSKAIMPTTFAALCERERLAAFADVCRQWGF